MWSFDSWIEYHNMRSRGSQAQGCPVWGRLEVCPGAPPRRSHGPVRCMKGPRSGQSRPEEGRGIRPLADLYGLLLSQRHRRVEDEASLRSSSALRSEPPPDLHRGRANRREGEALPSLGGRGLSPTNAPPAGDDVAINLGGKPRRNWTRGTGLWYSRQGRRLGPNCR